MMNAAATVKRIGSTLLAGIVLSCLLAPMAAQAGNVTITGMKVGSDAYIQRFDRNGKLIPPEIKVADGADGKRDGKVTVKLENQAGISYVKVFRLDPDGKRQIDERKLVVGTLPSLEPFDLPVFSPINTDLALATQIDVNAFLAQGVQWAPGQIFNVIEGMIAESSATSFRDASSLAFPPNTPPDTGIFDTLPTFTGQVQLTSFDTFAVPEPATLTALGLGLAALVRRRRK